MSTIQGDGRLRIRADDTSLLLDHDFETPETSLSVLARVIPNGLGSEFMMTFLKPGDVTAGQFEQQASTIVDSELRKLKEILESA